MTNTEANKVGPMKGLTISHVAANMNATIPQRNKVVNEIIVFTLAVSCYKTKKIDNISFFYDILSL